MRGTRAGVSVIEVLIVVSILVLLGYIAVVGFAERRDNALVRGAAEAIQFQLEAAKADALAGRNNEAQGIKFNSDSYVAFSGSSYDSGDSSNVSYDIDDSLEISTTLSGDETVIFSRLTAETGSTATVTVAIIADSSIFQQIVIGERGDVNFIDQ